MSRWLEGVTRSDSDDEEVFSFDIDSPSSRKRGNLRRKPSSDGSKSISRSNSERGGGSRKRGYNHVVIVSEDEEEGKERDGGDRGKSAGDAEGVRERGETTKNNAKEVRRGVETPAELQSQRKDLVREHTETINLVSESSVSEQCDNREKRVRQGDSFVEETVVGGDTPVLSRRNTGEELSQGGYDKELSQDGYKEGDNIEKTSGKDIDGKAPIEDIGRNIPIEDNKNIPIEDNKNIPIEEEPNQITHQESDSPSLEDSLLIEVNKPSRSTPVTEFGSILLFDKMLEDASHVSTYRCECQLVGHNQRVPLQSLYEEAPRIVGGGSSVEGVSFVASLEAENLFVSGLLVVPKGEEKMVENCGDNCLILVCLEGEKDRTDVVINGNSYLLNRSDVCWVPKGNEWVCR